MSQRAKQGSVMAALAVFSFLVAPQAYSQNHLAQSSVFCEQPKTLSAAQQDKLLRFSELIKQELAASGRPAAIVSRSGLNLERFNTRYSHSGFALQNSSNAPWSVRQLYFACDEGKPRIFDQGMAGFVMGMDSPQTGYMSVLLLPQPEAAQLETTALSNQQALALLHPDYSANAYAFSSQYQNCNQWTIELLAALALQNQASNASASRSQAQQYLLAQNYQPSLMQVGNPLLMLATSLLPLLHNRDHPLEDRAAWHYKVSMPASIEQWVRQRYPDTEKREFCFNDEHIVIRQGWAPIAQGCVATSGDRVFKLSERPAVQ
jgi:hypothetical protein